WRRRTNVERIVAGNDAAVVRIPEVDAYRRLEPLTDAEALGNQAGQGSVRAGGANGAKDRTTAALDLDELRGIREELELPTAVGPQRVRVTREVTNSEGLRLHFQRQCRDRRCTGIRDLAPYATGCPRIPGRGVVGDAVVQSVTGCRAHCDVDLARGIRAA